MWRKRGGKRGGRGRREGTKGIGQSRREDGVGKGFRRQKEESGEGSWGKTSWRSQGAIRREEEGRNLPAASYLSRSAAYPCHESKAEGISNLESAVHPHVRSPLSSTGRGICTLPSCHVAHQLSQLHSPRLRHARSCRPVEDSVEVLEHVEEHQLLPDYQPPASFIPHLLHVLPQPRQLLLSQQPLPPVLRVVGENFPQHLRPLQHARRPIPVRRRHTPHQVSDPRRKGRERRLVGRVPVPVVVLERKRILLPVSSVHEPRLEDEEAGEVAEDEGTEELGAHRRRERLGPSWHPLVVRSDRVGLPLLPLSLPRVVVQRSSCPRVVGDLMVIPDRDQGGARAQTLKTRVLPGAGSERGAGGQGRAVRGGGRIREVSYGQCKGRMRRREEGKEENRSGEEQGGGEERSTFQGRRGEERRAEERRAEEGRGEERGSTCREHALHGRKEEERTGQPALGRDRCPLRSRRENRQHASRSRARSALLPRTH
eukprot:656804-Hanusia_phi.AAC.2